MKEVEEEEEEEERTRSFWRTLALKFLILGRYVIHMAHSRGFWEVCEYGRQDSGQKQRSRKGSLGLEKVSGDEQSYGCVDRLGSDGWKRKRRGNYETSPFPIPLCFLHSSFSLSLPVTQRVPAPLFWPLKPNTQVFFLLTTGQDFFFFYLVFHFSILIFHVWCQALCQNNVPAFCNAIQIFPS